MAKSSCLLPFQKKFAMIRPQRYLAVLFDDTTRTRDMGGSKAQASLAVQYWFSQGGNGITSFQGEVELGLLRRDIITECGVEIWRLIKCQVRIW